MKEIDEGEEEARGKTDQVRQRRGKTRIGQSRSAKIRMGSGEQACSRIWERFEAREALRLTR
jgi:hypothetical protein